MRVRLLLSSAMAAGALCHTPLFAQDDLELKTSEELERKTERVLGAGAPLSRTGSAISASNLQIAISEGEQELALGVDFDLFRSKRLPPQDRPDEFRVSSLNLTIKGSTPLNEEEGENSNFFSGNSFVDGSQVTVGLTYFTSTQRSGIALFDRDENPSLFRQVLTACAVKEANMLAGDDVAKQSLALEFIERVNTSTKPPTAFSQYIRLDIPEENANLTEFSKAYDEKCASGGFDAKVRTYLPDLYDSFERAAYSDKPMFFFGASGTIGDENFGVLNRTDFRVDDVSRTPWQTDAYAGFIGPDLNWSARASIFYGASYEAPDNAEFCRTEDDADEECIMGPDGNPTRNESARFALESRHLFSIAGGNQIGFAPEFTYDLEEDEFQIEVPFYFSPDKEGNLSGGIITRYESEDDDFSIGLFVGVPFSIQF